MTFTRATPGGCLAAFLVGSLTWAANAQPADEHSGHHPGAAAPSTPSGTPREMIPSAPLPEAGDGAPLNTKPLELSPPQSNTTPPAAPVTGGILSRDPVTGCAGQGCITGGPQDPIYPTLMSLPKLTPEKRAEIEALASQQLKIGHERMATGSALLASAEMAKDYKTMQQAAGEIRAAIAQIGAGIAARRVLEEGEAPRTLALQWFKDQMNLTSPLATTQARRFFGLVPFHFFTMALLLAFALAMIAMYFFKMRRAFALFKRVEPTADSLKPGVGSAPKKATWQGRLRIDRIVTETPSVKTFRLVPASGDATMPFFFVPGQFLNVTFFIGGAKMQRSYSLSSSPNQHAYVELTIRRPLRRSCNLSLGLARFHLLTLFLTASVLLVTKRTLE